jgi:hypothetical protein
VLAERQPRLGDPMARWTTSIDDSKYCIFGESTSLLGGALSQPLLYWDYLKRGNSHCEDSEASGDFSEVPKIKVLDLAHAR